MNVLKDLFACLGGFFCTYVQPHPLSVIVIAQGRACLHYLTQQTQNLNINFACKYCSGHQTYALPSQPFLKLF